MSLRPRYSLLTLLLLTAAVAGGMKYWKGPHWTELVDLPAVEEKAFFAKHPHLWQFIYDYGTEKIRYQFTRSWDSQSWHLLEGRDFQRPVLITLAPHQLISGYPWALPLKKGWQPIVYWIAGVGAKPEEDSLYLLAEDKNVYRVLLPPWEGIASFTLNDVENPDVRRRLAEEIQKLQAKQTNTSAAP